MIEINNVSKIYDSGTKALSDVSFKINKGEIVGVIGRNGAGKSTLFKVICGLITDYTGESKVFGQESNIYFSDHISYLPEVRGLDQRAYIIEHLTDLVRYKGFSKKEATEAVTRWLNEFSLYKYRYQKISSLSKGNQQKLQLIVAVASNPKILILDEPFSGLDLITIDFFWQMILKLREQGCTILFSTHDLNDNLLNCNRFIFINKGVLRQNGSLPEIQKYFDMILEIRNESVRLNALQAIAGEENVQDLGGEYHVRIKDESMAHAIFDSLEQKYSEKFYVRKMTIPEIFREICGGEL